LVDTVITEDSSSTFFNKKFGEHYHSTYGAIRESRHIFIDAGLMFISHGKKEINILEMGFGTGLNAFLSCNYASANKIRISYLGIEAFPIDLKDAGKLNFPELLETNPDIFLRMHGPEMKYEASEHFYFEKHIGKLEGTALTPKHFDLVFFDAFSPGSQPELWTKEIFMKINKSLKTGGILTSYSCKGFVKRNLKSSGFSIKKLPGPPGKREFLRATKIEEA